MTFQQISLCVTMNKQVNIDLNSVISFIISKKQCTVLYEVFKETQRLTKWDLGMKDTREKLIKSEQSVEFSQWSCININRDKCSNIKCKQGN